MPFAPIILRVVLGGLCLAADASPLKSGSAAPVSGSCRVEAGPKRAVVRVIDAETLLLDDGKQMRLVGALAPDAVEQGSSADTWLPDVAARERLAALVAGKTIELAYPAGRRFDRYGRHLAQVYVGDGANRRWVQRELVENGLARAAAGPGQHACIADLIALERVARLAVLGLWSNSAYKVREAWKTRTLLAQIGTFQLVEGRVRDVARTGQRSAERIYLNFGRNWRWDFTAGVSLAGRDDADAVTTRLQALKGKRVIVRGWIERRNGPYIDVTELAQIESVEATPDAAPSR